LFCLSINTDVCIKKVDKEVTERRNDGANQIMHLVPLQPLNNLEGPINGFTHMMPLQPSNSLKDPIDGFTHMMQAPGHPHDGPTEPIDISCHSKPLSPEQVCNSSDFRALVLILSCQTILYQVQLLEAHSLQMVIEVEGMVVEGAEPEGMVIDVARMR
jgi:hypothetical protein